jgi:hypothetical protein
MNDVPQAVMRAARAACAGPDGGTAGGGTPEGAPKTAELLDGTEDARAHLASLMEIGPASRGDPLLGARSSDDPG